MLSCLHCFAHASLNFAKEVGLNSSRKHGTGRDNIQCRSSSCSAGFHPKDASHAFAVPFEDLHTASHCNVTSSAMVHEVKGKCGWSHQLPDPFEQINVHTEVRYRKVSCKKVARGS